MATNTVLLKSIMILNSDTVQALALSLGANRQNISAKLNGKRDFKQSEINKIIARYNLSDTQIRAIFFNNDDYKEVS
jgi:hypothetical protein